MFLSCVEKKRKNSKWEMTRRKILKNPLCGGIMLDSFYFLPLFVFMKNLHENELFL